MGGPLAEHVGIPKCGWCFTLLIHYIKETKKTKNIKLKDDKLSH